MIKVVKWLGNFVFRMVLGAVGIFALNAILGWTPWNAVVGINMGTMATVGLLGAPGFLLLYGIMIYEAVNI